jgi:Ferritin-like domain
VEKPTRRRLLAAGFSGTALGLLGSRAVSASPDTTTPTSDEGSTPAESAPAATTTTLPPKRPTDADVPYLQFAESFELAAHDLYQAALDAGAEEETLTAFRDNHQAYASVIKGQLGTLGALSRDDEVYDQFEAEFATSDVTALATSAAAFESTLVATYAEMLGQLEGVDGAHLLASIMMVEARQAAVLVDVSGRGDDYDAMFADDAPPLPASATSGG